MSHEQAISAIERGMQFLVRDMDIMPPFSDEKREVREEVDNLREIVRRLKNRR